MPYTYNWLVEGRIMSLHAYGKWTLDELDTSVREFAEKYLDESSQHVHLVINVSEITSMPYNVKRIKEAVTPLHAHEMSEWTVFVGMKNPVMKMVVAIITQLNNRKVKEVETQDDALHFLRRVDVTLLE
ncbi:MAG: hypothetical protein ACPG7F_04055 [Aggregatilineales bacterium]